MEHSRSSRRRFLASAAAAPLVLTGCNVPGFSSRPEGDDNTIVLWYWNRSIDPQLFRDFEEAHPGVTVNDQLVGGDYASRFNTTLAGQAFVPDVVALNNDISRYFPDADQFVDLYEMGAEEDRHLYLDWKWKAGETLDGRLIGYPMDTGPLALYYRHDFFEQAGLPTEPDDVTAQFAEWEDYFEAGLELQQALPGVRMMDNVPYIYLMALMQAQEFYVNRDQVYVGDGESVRRAWDVALQAYGMDLAARVNPFTPDWSAGVSESSFASFVGAVWMKQFLLESGNNVAGTWRVAQTPGGPGNQGGSFIGITKYARNKELCFELIRTIMSPESQVRMYKSLSLFPSAIDALEDPVMSEPEDFFGGQPTAEQFVTTAKELEPFYFSPAYPIAHGIFNQEITDVVLGGAPEDVAWDEAQKQAKRELQHKAPWVKWEEAS